MTFENSLVKIACRDRLCDRDLERRVSRDKTIGSVTDCNETLWQNYSLTRTVHGKMSITLITKEYGKVSITLITKESVKVSIFLITREHQDALQ